MKISILIPLYNEAGTLSELLERVQAAELPAGCDKEIVIMNDGSTDRTNALLKSIARNNDVIVVHLARNRGKGTAIRAGIAVATGDVILIQDGDLEYDPADYKSVLAPFVGGDAHVVFGSRFLGRCEAMKWQNRLANKILTTTANLLYHTNLTDQGTAYKAFRADILRSIDLKSERFEFCAEVTAKVRKLGHTIHEVPIIYKARTVGEGKKIRTKDGFQALWTLLKFRFSSPFLISITARVSQSKALYPRKGENPFT
jgi:dolichol-phosphate mannosyltransferase